MQPHFEITNAAGECYGTSLTPKKVISFLRASLSATLVIYGVESGEKHDASAGTSVGAEELDTVLSPLLETGDPIYLKTSWGDLTIQPMASPTTEN
jgi:hypothetical protein